MVYLNHGSFGATPRIVLEAQRAIQDRLEAEPVHFFLRDLFDEIDRTRAAFADQCGADPGDYVMLRNATHAVATVLHNQRFEPGDELLTTTHAYPACVNNLQRAAERDGATVVQARLPFPVASEDELFHAVIDRVTPRTRLAMLDHVTSPTGLVLPIERLVAALDKRGVDTLVDGAHAPGMLEIDLGAMRPAYYTANAHKWFCAPKGCAFLYVRPDKQPAIRPLALSNHARGAPFNHPTQRSLFNLEFDYAGTDDPSAWLAVPAAIDFLSGLFPGGMPALRSHNHDLAIAGRGMVCERLGLDPPAPEAMVGSIATVLLPDLEPELAERLASTPATYLDALQDALVENHRIQIPVWSFRSPQRGGGDELGGGITRLIRLSAQSYNTPAQYEYLAEALAIELDAERRL